MGELIEIDPARKRRELEPLWRDVVGRKLRDLRHEQGERLVETATRAGISPQYLSEVERGRKDPSSEMLAAIAGALGTSLLDLTTDIARELGATRSTASTAPAPTASPSTAPASTAPASTAPSSSAPRAQLLALAA